MTYPIHWIHWNYWISIPLRKNSNDQKSYRCLREQILTVGRVEEQVGQGSHLESRLVYTS